MIWRKILFSLRTSIYAFLAIMFGSLCLAAIFLHAWSIPGPVILSQNFILLIIIAAAELLMVCGIVYISRRTANYSSNRFVFAILTGYVIMQVSFILLFPVKQRSDADKVVTYAQNILNGDYSQFKVGHYLSFYPNNIGITLIFAFLYSFLPKSLITIRLCNVIFSTATAFLTYKLYKEISPEEKNARGVLIITIMFIPAIILNNFTYGDVMCTTFCVGAMICAIRFVKGGKVRYIILTSLLLMTANFIRQVALLFLGGILLYWFAKGIFEKKADWKKSSAGILLAICIFNLPVYVFNKIGLEKGILEEPIGSHANPPARWLDIGFPYGDNIGYWDGGSNTRIFLKDLGSDAKHATHVFMEDIKAKYDAFGFIDVAIGYMKKTFWVWTEGTYNVNFYGLSQSRYEKNFFIYKTPAIEYLNKGKIPLKGIIEWYLHSYNWLTLSLLFYYLVHCLVKKDYSMELFAYIILLYAVFYLLWEVKSRYLFGLYPIYIIISYKAISEIAFKLAAALKKRALM